MLFESMFMNFESNGTKQCIPTLFETMFGAVERNVSIVFHITQRFENKNDTLYILTLFKPMHTPIPKDTFHAMDWTNRQ